MNQGRLGKVVVRINQTWKSFVSFKLKSNAEQCVFYYNDDEFGGGEEMKAMDTLGD